MKKISLFIILGVLAISCNLANPRKGNIDETNAIGYDVLYYEARDSIISLTGEIQLLRDSLINNKILITQLKNDNYFLKSENKTIRDSINIYKEDAFVYKYKIERIKAYDNIVRNNSSQSKFFLGWVRRVLED